MDSFEESENSEEAFSNKTVDNSIRDALADGLINLLRPVVEEIDERVKGVRQSQVDLRQHIDNLAEDLKSISDTQPVNIELDSYVKKLNNARRRVMLVNSILQNAQDRLNKLHHNVSKETARRKAQLDPTALSLPK